MPGATLIDGGTLSFTLAADIEAWDEVAATGLVTAEEALASFRADSGLGEALGALEHNPLPHLITVMPAAGHDSPEAIEAMAERLRALPEADLVQADADWVRRLFAMLDIARRLATLAAVAALITALIRWSASSSPFQNSPTTMSRTGSAAVTPGRALS